MRKDTRNRRIKLGIDGPKNKELELLLELKKVSGIGIELLKIGIDTLELELALKTLRGAYSVYASSSSPSQRSAPTTIVSRSRSR